MMNIPTFDLKLLRCFTVLMAERSVSRAAARLDLSQPAMSHALGRLRRLFDDPLLLKGQGGMTPTSRAIELESEVRALLAGAERLVSRPREFDAKTARMRFVVMTPEYVEYLLAPRLVGRLQSEAPGIDIAFRTSDPEHARDWLERGDIDFRLGWLPSPPQALRAKFLFRDSLVCLARRGNPLVRGRIGLDEYLASPHVRLEQPRTRVSTEAVDAAVATLGRALRVALQVQNALALAHAVSQSNVIATVPERLAHALAQRFPVQSVALPIDVPDVRIAMYWHERTHKQPAHRWFRQLLGEVAKAP